MCTAVLQHPGVSCRMSTLQQELTPSKSLDRLLHKGPEFIRSYNNNNNSIFAHRRKSAVELLEASKSEYVKSTSVLNHRQELRHPEKLHIGTRPKSAGNTPIKKSSFDYSSVAKTPENGNVVDASSRLTPSKPESLSRTTKSVASRLNEVLKDSPIKICENANKEQHTSVASPVTNYTASLTSNADISNNNINKNQKSFVLDPNMAHSNAKTLVPKDKMTDSLIDSQKSSRSSKDFLLPNTHQSLSTSVTVLVEKRCMGVSSVSQAANDIAVLRRKKKTLHRSQSDLSGRHSRNSSDFSDLSSRLSRTSTELERFFNEMGIDRSVLDPMLRMQKTKKKESELFESLSSLELNSDARSTCSGISQNGKTQTEKDLKERNHEQTSVVEKNARIIKWLCNVKKASGPPAQQAS